MATENSERWFLSDTTEKATLTSDFAGVEHETATECSPIAASPGMTTLGSLRTLARGADCATRSPSK